MKVYVSRVPGDGQRRPPDVERIDRYIDERLAHPLRGDEPAAVPAPVGVHVHRWRTVGYMALRARPAVLVRESRCGLCRVTQRDAVRAG